MRKSKDDCLRQCISRVIGKKPKYVPHFVRKYRGRWPWYLGEWLGRRGYSTIFAPRFGRGHFCYARSNRSWIEIGPVTRKKKSRRHAIVMRGKKVIYDGGRSIIRTDGYLFIFRTGRPRR